MLFDQFVYDQTPAKYSDKVLLWDDDYLKDKMNIDGEFRASGFEIIEYTDDLKFRIEHEEDMKAEGKKLAVFANSKSYVPYDLLKRMAAYKISMQSLFGDLQTEPLASLDKTGLDLVVQAYMTAFVKNFNKAETEAFIEKQAFSKENVSQYLDKLITQIDKLMTEVKTPQEWFKVAELKAEVQVLGTRYEVPVDMDYVNDAFRDYCMKEFGFISSKLDREGPVLVSRAMEFMKEHSDKFVVLVMDGMSEVDWNIISESFSGIHYHKASAMAMIPSTTSVSRQCLLGGKLPMKLESPWKQDKEKKEFVACAKELGYKENQIGYARGYGADFSSVIKCAVVIIMDVDEIVHAEKQGRIGMIQDIELLTKQGKLAALTKRLLAQGFDVYITADHGNTDCTGIGHVTGIGVEVETKSRRFLVLKDFADKNALKEKYGLLEYPKYYLPKEYDYMICDNRKSFDKRGEEVISHGGITIDEVVVPFIKLKAVENNG